MCVKKSLFENNAQTFITNKHSSCENLVEKIKFSFLSSNASHIPTKVKN